MWWKAIGSSCTRVTAWAKTSFLNIRWTGKSVITPENLLDVWWVTTSALTWLSNCARSADNLSPWTRNLSSERMGVCSMSWARSVLKQWTRLTMGHQPRLCSPALTSLAKSGSSRRSCKPLIYVEFLSGWGYLSDPLPNQTSSLFIQQKYSSNSPKHLMHKQIIGIFDYLSKRKLALWLSDHPNYIWWHLFFLLQYVFF